MSKSSFSQITKQDTIGVIGLGHIGGGVAECLSNAGWHLVVHDVSSQVASSFEDHANVVGSPAEMARKCRTILVAVYDADQVDAIFSGPDGVLSAGSSALTVLILSTIPVARLLAVAHTAAAHGVSVLDCGITPGNVAAEGRLITYVGGSAEQVVIVKPVLDEISSKSLHMGPLGAGMQAKIINNVTVYISMLAMWEARNLAKEAGLDLAKLAAGIWARDSMMKGQTGILTSEDRPLEARQYIANVLHKDLGAALELAQGFGVSVPAIKLADSLRKDMFGLT